LKENGGARYPRPTLAGEWPSLATKPKLVGQGWSWALSNSASPSMRPSPAEIGPVKLQRDMPEAPSHWGQEPAGTLSGQWEQQAHTLPQQEQA
jgi:hypothetical protein